MSEKPVPADTEFTLNEEDRRKQCCSLYVPKRLIVVALSCLGMIVIHAMRVGLSITVITILDANAHHKLGSDLARANLPKVDWNSKMVGFLHSVFYIGFILTQIPGGFYAAKLSGHRIFGSAILLSSALNMLIPVAIADIGYVATCAIRFLQGLVEGVAIPSVYRVLRDWSPTSSISRYGGWIFAGMYAGPILGFPIDGTITHYLSWELVFYFHGGVGVIWFIFWFIFVFESPEKHPSISKSEKILIMEDKDKTEKTIPPVVDPPNTVTKLEVSKVPWKEIFLSKPVWAVMICHFIKNWMFYLMLTSEPMYLNQFHFSLFENGIFSAIPHFLKVITTLISGYIADLTLKNCYMTRTNVRKMMTGVGFLGEAVCCFGLYFIYQGHLAIAILALGIGVSGITASGWQINHLDLAPEYASVLAGISSAFGTVGGILSPVLVSLITHPQTLNNWQKAFMLNAGVIAAGAIFYLIFGSGEQQPWSSPSETKNLTSSVRKDKRSLSETE